MRARTAAAAAAAAAARPRAAAPSLTTPRPPRFTSLHGFKKPADERGLALMDAAALEVLGEFPDVRLAFGESDEFSFVFARRARVFGRRAAKLVSVVASLFAAAYVRAWPRFFPATPLAATPAFDGRAVCYPDAKTLRDYLAWRQADTHINCQYNTCFWALVQRGGATPAEAQAALKGTLADFKNELLFSRFGLNYNELPPRFRKGSTLVRERVVERVERPGGAVVEKEARRAAVLHVDLIRDDFWDARPELLAD